MDGWKWVEVGIGSVRVDFTAEQIACRHSDDLDGAQVVQS